MTARPFIIKGVWEIVSLALCLECLSIHTPELMISPSPPLCHYWSLQRKASKKKKKKSRISDGICDALYVAI